MTNGQTGDSVKHLRSGTEPLTSSVDHFQYWEDEVCASPGGCRHCGPAPHRCSIALGSPETVNELKIGTTDTFQYALSRHTHAYLYPKYCHKVSMNRTGESGDLLI